MYYTHRYNFPVFPVSNIVTMLNLV